MSLSPGVVLNAVNFDLEHNIQLAVLDRRVAYQAVRNLVDRLPAPKVANYCLMMMGVDRMPEVEDSLLLVEGSLLVAVVDISLVDID